MKKKFLSDQDLRNSVLQLIAAGSTVSELAEKFNCPRSTLHDFLYENAKLTLGLAAKIFPSLKNGWMEK